MKIKLTRAEKQLVRAMVSYNNEKQLENNAQCIEYDFMKYTGISNMEHRYLVEDYAQSIIDN